MSLRAKISGLRQTITPYLGFIAFAAACVALFWLLPARTAAVILGIVVAVLVHHLFLSKSDRAVQLAVFWAAAAVTADAAYAKLNDIAPVTIVGGVAKFAAALVKLGEGVVSGAGIPLTDVRVNLRVASVTPDFIWALVLTVVVLMAVNFFSPRKGPAPRR